MLYESKRDKTNRAFTDDETAKKVLMNEVKILRKIFKEEWKKYLKSYKPTRYVRGGNMTAIGIEEAFRGLTKSKITKTATGWEITVAFSNDLMYHESVMRGGEKGHSLWLISEGWAWRTAPRKQDRFKRYSGFGILSKVQARYKVEGDPYVKLKIEWTGKKK